MIKSMDFPTIFSLFPVNLKLSHANLLVVLCVCTFENLVPVYTNVLLQVPFNFAKEPGTNHNFLQRSEFENLISDLGWFLEVVESQFVFIFNDKGKLIIITFDTLRNDNSVTL